jgi:hypothetical protein
MRAKPVIGRRGPIPHMAEVELENISTQPVNIAYRMTVLQYLNLVVSRADGMVISEGHFGDRFAPTLEEQVLQLQPGETFTAQVPLFATVAGEAIPSGKYAVQAVYEYQGWRAISDPVEVIV